MKRGGVRRHSARYTNGNYGKVGIDLRGIIPALGNKWDEREWKLSQGDAHDTFSHGGEVKQTSYEVYNLKKKYDRDHFEKEKMDSVLSPSQMRL